VIAGEHAARPEHARDFRQAAFLAPPGLSNVLQHAHRCNRVEGVVGVGEQDRLALIPTQEGVLVIREPTEERPLEQRIARCAVAGTLQIIGEVAVAGAPVEHPGPLGHVSPEETVERQILMRAKKAAELE